MRVIGVSILDIAVMSMCQTCTNTMVATMTTRACVVRSAMATCAERSGPDPAHRPSRTTDIERLTTKFATGMRPAIKSVQASSVAPMRNSSQSSTRASEISKRGTWPRDDRLATLLAAGIDQTM